MICSSVPVGREARQARGERILTDDTSQKQAPSTTKPSQHVLTGKPGSSRRFGTLRNPPSNLLNGPRSFGLSLTLLQFDLLIQEVVNFP